MSKDEYQTPAKKREQREMMLPIFSTKPNSFQIDTFENKRGSKQPYYLMAINTNSRKAYAIPMDSKDKHSVIEALKKLKKMTPINYLYSDRDTAYTSNETVKWLHENNIELDTTDEINKHSNLALINRLIRTLRKKNDCGQDEYKIEADEMDKVLDWYNNRKHDTTGIIPNKFSKTDEENYINHQQNITDIKKTLFHINPDEKVRYLQEYGPLEKRRYNLSKEYYKVDSYQGGSVLLKAQDNTVNSFPRWKLSKNVQGSNFGNNFNRQVIQKIVNYDAKKDRYNVVWADGSKTIEKSRVIREQHPTKFTPMEREYWSKKNVPDKLLGFV